MPYRNPSDGGIRVRVHERAPNAKRRIRRIKVQTVLEELVEAVGHEEQVAGVVETERRAPLKMFRICRWPTTSARNKSNIVGKLFINTDSSCFDHSS
jgi:hypothetical protein